MDAPDAGLETLPVDEASVPADPADPVEQLPEARAARYRIGGEVGRGGLGRVLRAEDLALHRTVAIKELLGRDEAARARFVREAMITARLQHPSIVPLYDAGRWADRSPFYAMKLVAGRPLADALASRPTLVARLELLPSMLAVVDAVAYAHSQEIIHRDLKPQNVLVGEFGETIVIDWGLAKDLGDRDPEPGDAGARAGGDDQTVAGAVLGTPAYMAPEQARGDAADARTDVYALGAMLFHLVAGTPPHHDAGSVEAVLARLREGRVPSLRDREPATPPDLAAIVAKAMRADPDARYRSASEMAVDLRRFTAGQLVGAYRYSFGELLRRWIRRHRAIAATVAIAVAIAAIGTAWFLVRERRLRGHAERAQGDAEIARDDARAAERDARRGLARQLVERGRQELLAHHPGRAAAYLSAAYPDLADDASLRFLLGGAMRDVERSVAVVRPGAALREVDLHPDGRTVVTLTTKGVVQLWDAAGTLRATLTGHDGDVASAAFTPDGRVVTAGDDHTVRLWDAATGREVMRVDEPDEVAAATVSRDGRLLTVGRDDDTARVRDLATGKLLASLTVTTNDLSISRDGRSVMATDDTTAVVWDVASASPRLTLTMSENIWESAFSADGRRIATGAYDGTVRVWDAQTGALVAEIAAHELPIRSMDISADGRRVLTASDDATARIWDVATRAPVLTLEGHTDTVWSTRLTADDRMAVTASFDGTARAWDVAATGLLGRFDGIAPPTWQAAVNTEGMLVVVSDTLQIWDGALTATPTKLPLRVEPAPRWPESVSFTPDGQSLVVGASDHTVTIWDRSTGAAIARLAGHSDDIGGIDFSRDGRRVLTQSYDGTARVWDAATGAVLVTVADHGGSVHSAVFSPDGERVVTTGLDWTARLWDARTGVTLETFDQLGDGNIETDFSADGRRLVLAGGTGGRVWDLASRRVVATIEGHDGPMWSAELSPDDRRIVTGNGDRTARVWDASTGALLVTLEGHLDGMYASFSPDGAMIVTAGRDDTMRIWDSDTGDVLAIYPCGGPVRSAQFDPADGRVMTTTDGGTQVWDVRRETRRPEEIEAIVAARVPWTVRDGLLVRR